MTTQDPFEQSQTSSQPQLRLAFDLALWRQQEQQARNRALESKLGYAFGLSAALVAVFGTALLFASDASVSQVRVAMIVAAALFITGIVVSALAFVIGRWALAPNLNRLLEYAESVDEEDLLRWATNSLLDATASNERWLWLKGLLVSAAIGLAAGTAVTIAVAAILAAG